MIIEINIILTKKLKKKMKDNIYIEYSVCNKKQYYNNKLFYKKPKNKDSL